MSDSRADKSATTSPRATYQDVVNAPEHMVAEIVDGKLYTHPRPSPPHAIAHSRLGYLIEPPFDFGDGGPGGWWVLDEPELHFDEDIVVPDIAGWRRERMPVPPSDAYFTLAPDWVCEVLSPSTRKLDLGGKLKVYARAGVSYIWFLDPTDRSLAAYQLGKTQWELVEKLYEDASVSLLPFDAIRFNLSNLWLPHTVHRGLPGQSNIESKQNFSEGIE